MIIFAMSMKHISLLNNKRIIVLLLGKDRVRNEMKKLLTVKSNVDLILGVEPEEVKRERSQER